MPTPTVSISAAAASAQEGGLLSYTLMRTGDGSDTLPVYLFVTGTGANPASPGSDVTVPLTVTFLAGETSKTLVFPAATDTIVEQTEGFSVAVMSSSSYTVGAGPAVFSITDKPFSTVSIAADAAQVTEGGSTTLTLTRTGDLSEGILVNVTAGGTGSNAASLGSDFNYFGVVYFAPGQATRTTQVFVTADSTTEPTETATFSIGASPAYAVSPSAGTASFQILDPGPVVASIAAATPTVTEGYNGQTLASFTISLDHAVGYGVQVNYTTSPGTATGGEDYSITSGSITFAAGETSKTVTVPVFGDTKAEGNETFLVGLTGVTSFGAPASLNSSASSATVTITNDDVLPVVSVVALDGHAFESNANDQLIFLFQRTGDLSASLNVPIAIAAAATMGATPGTDFTGPGGAALLSSVFFQAGSATATLFMSPVNDSASEDVQERFTVSVSPGSTYAVHGTLGSAIGTIIDDETAGTASPSTLSLSGVDTSALEGGFLTFKITRTGDLSTGVTASVSTVPPTPGGTDVVASPGSDFIAPITARMLAGESERTFTIVVNKDALTEGTETFGLQLNPSMNYAVDSSSAQPTFTITDVAPSVVSLTAATASASEGFPLAYTVARTGGDLAVGLVVNLNVAGSGANPASPGSDFVAPLSVVFAPNETSRTISISTLVDAVAESTETLTLSLSTVGAAYAVDSSSNSASFSILNVAPPVVSIAAVSSTITEGADGQSLASFAISLDHAVGYGFSVAYNTVAGTATLGSDVSGFGGSAFFAAGETAKTITVPVFGDLVSEADETFSIQLGTPTAFGSPQTPTVSPTAASATVTILNDDVLPVISIQATDGVNKEGFYHSFLATRTGDLSSFLSVGYTVNAGATNGATPGTDTAAPSFPSIFFSAGSATALFGVTSLTDSVVEPNETFVVALTSGAGYAVSPTAGSATGTILDAPPAGPQTVSLSVTSTTVTEGGSFFYTLTRSGDTSGPLTVQLNAAGSGTNPAAAGSDFSAPMSVSFAAGMTSVSAFLYTLTDSLTEPSETLTLSIAPSANYSIGTGNGAILTILDKPPATVTVTATDATATEGVAGDTLSFTFTRTGSTSDMLTVSYSIPSSGTNVATAGSDFSGSSFGSVTFQAGSSTAVLTITVLDDAVMEPTETVAVSISSGFGYVAGSPSTATASIVDNDTPQNQLPAGTSSLTGNADILSPNSVNDFVSGIASTLNAYDSLDAGGGTDVLSLTGAGTFNLATLSSFSGFEEVRLTNVTSSGATLTLRDGVNLAVTLSDGTTAPPTMSMPGLSLRSVNLSTGLNTITGSNGADSFQAGKAGHLQAGTVLDGGAGFDTLSLGTPGSTYNGTTFVPPPASDTTYDLTAISLSHVETIQLTGTFPTTVKVDSAALTDVTNISGFSGTNGASKLTTAASTLDLTGKSISGVMVESTNGTGTTFTTNTLATAYQVAGGAGQDKVVVTGLTLTSAQRDQIFTNSVETIQDASGTYTKPPLPPGAVELTSGADTVAASGADQLVYATASTLNPTDSLDAGGGTDVLSLTGAGTFNLATLSSFSGFEEVRLTNVTSSGATLTLRDGVNLAVTLSDGTTAPPTMSMPGLSLRSVNLSTGLNTITGSNGADSFQAGKAGHLQAGTVLDGGAGFDTLSLGTPGSTYNGTTFVPPPASDTTYDLTAISLSHVETIQLTGTFPTTVKVDSAALTDVTNISGFSGTNGASKLTTAASTLDLTGKSITGVMVESTNGAGTTFTTNSLATAYQVAGGAGQDKVVVTGLTLTSAQRDQIFTNSVETIQDASGTYTKPPLPPGAVELTSGADTVAASGADQLVYATASTLNPTDSLDAGGGTDVLSLTGAGTFNLATLSSFSGFEEVRLTNVTSSGATLTLRDGVNLAVTLSDGTTAPPTMSMPGLSLRSVNLSTGLNTITGSNGADSFQAGKAGHLQAGTVLDGGAGFDTLSLGTPGSTYNGTTFVPPPASDTTYDLTAISLSHVETIQLTGTFPTTVKVDSAALTDVTNISGFSGTNGASKLTTAASTLDLTGKSITGVMVESTNGAGTTFTTNSLATAYQVAGGAGQDKVVVTGLTLTSAQRDQIFTNSVETIQDSSGTYTKGGGSTPALPTVSISAGTASATEGAPLSYVVTRSGDTSGALTVNLNVAGSGANPATPGTDFFAPLTVSFVAGETSKTASITTSADATVEPTETFTLSIAANASYNVGTGSATFSILDGPSSTPTVSVAATDGAATEGAAGDSIVFTFTRTGSTSQPLSVNFTTGPTGTFGATPGQDYPAGATGTVSFLAGSSTATLTLFPNDDFNVEPTETFRVSVATGSGYAVSTNAGSAIGTITDNDTNVLNLWRTPDTVTQPGQHFYRPNAASFSGTQEWVFTTTPAAGFSPTGDELITFALRGQSKFGTFDETTTTVATFTGPSETGGGIGSLLFGQSGSTLNGGAFWMERLGADLDLKYRTYTVDTNGIPGPGAGTTLTGSTVTLLSGLTGVGTYYDWTTSSNSSTFAFAYEQISGATKDIILARFNPDGSAIGSPVTVVSALPASAQWATVVGNFFGILYEGTNGTNATFNLRSVLNDGTLSAVSAHVTDLTDITSLKGQTPLASGYMYSATGTKVGGTNSVIEFYQIDANNNDVGTGPRFSFDMAGSQVASRVLSTSVGGGEGYVAYLDPNDSTVHLVRVDQNGTLIGNITVPGLTQLDRMRSFGDGRVEFEYRQAVSGDENAVKTLIFDVRSNPLNVTGSANSDAIAGTIFADTINGGGGTDDLYGAAGIDKFVGTPSDLAGDTIRDIAPGETIALNGGWTVDSATLSGGVLTVGYHATAGGSAQNLAMNLPNADGRVSFSGNVVNYLAPLPTLSIAALNADRAEGSAGTTPFTFTVTRGGDTSGASMATYEVGSAAADGPDFTGGSLPTGTVAFAAGETSKTITIGVAGDSLFEADEAFTVTLSNATGATIPLASASATGTIRNDDLATPSVSLAAGVATAAEGGQLSYVVTRTGSTAGPLTVNLGVVGSGGDPATPGQDFFVPLTATIAAGQTSATVLFSAFADSLTEPTEGLTLSLTGSSGYTVAGGAGSATFSITDTPASNFPSVSLAAGTASAAEGEQLSYVVTRTGDTSSALTVNLGVVGSGANPATPGTDFYVPLTATIAAGQTSATVTFSAFVDSVSESTETFTLNLARSPNYVAAGGAGSAVFSITEVTPTPPPPPPLPTISVIASDSSGTEGTAGDDITFTFYRSGDTSGTLAVAYNLIGSGTNAATPGVDTSGPASGTVQFAAGSATATLTVTVVDDTLPEAREGLAAAVASGSGYQVASSGSVATAFINDNDATAPLPTVTVAATDASAVEGATGDTILFTFTRTGDTSAALTVNVATIGSGPNPASSTDYSAAPAGGTVTFAAGSDKATLVVTPVDDALVEPSEGLAVVVQSGSGYQVGSANVATATIVDDDATVPPPTITVSTSDGRAVEGVTSDTIAFTFQRTGDLTSPLTVNFASGGIGANPASTADHDAPATGTVTFAANSATAVLVVHTVDDSIVEPSEGLFVKVTGGAGYQLGQSNTIATATIADDDTPALPSLSIGDVTVTENLAYVGYADNPYNGGTTANPNGGFFNILFKVTLSAASSQPVTVAYSTPAMQGPDSPGYIDTNGTITFQPGETEKTIRVVGIDDFTPEDTKAFAVTLSGAANATIAKSQGLATVYDDDIAGGQAGRAVDGYISGATVFADANNNGVLDPGEAHTTTDATGSFVLSGGSGTIILFGGVDTATGLDFKGTLKAVGGSTVVTPLTTLVAAIAATGTSAQEAEATAKAALGLPASTSIGTFDPIAAATTGDATGQAAFVAGLKVINTAALVASTVAGGSGNYDAAFGSALAALAGKITDPTAPITIADLSSGATIGDLVTATAADQGAALPQAVVDAAKATIANLNTAVDAAAQGGGATLLADTSAVARVALGDASAALATVSDNPSQAAAVTQSYSGDALAQAVVQAQGQTGDLDGPNVESAPIGRADSYDAFSGAALIRTAATGVLANDVDPDGTPVTAVLIDGVDHGTLLFNTDGSFTYTATAGFVGSDSFTYQASDGGLTSPDVTVTLAVGLRPIAGDGDDNTFVLGTPGYALDGAGGVDTASFASRTAPVVVTLSGAADAPVTVGGVADGTLRNVENLTGGSGADTLTGDGAANRLNGGAGADQLAGRGGDDTYLVDMSTDVVIEAANEGTDTVISTAASFSLSGQYIEKLTLGGALAINGTGNSLDNLLKGNDAANTLDGGLGKGVSGNDTIDGGGDADTMIGRGGDDTYYVDVNGDVVVEAANEGYDTVISTAANFSLGGQYIEKLVLDGTAAISGRGNGLDNYLVGNSAANTLDGGVGPSGLSGNDTIDGGGGIDTMIGRGGNDIYYVNVNGDVVIEVANEGYDTVISTASNFSLAGQYIEKLVLDGTAAISGRGNGLDNSLVGNGAANTLDGGVGPSGVSGNDTLDGGGGIDTMIGRGGDDTYYVDVNGDVVIEAANEGYDTVISTAASFSLAGQYIEKLVLGGTAAINGTGNGLDNVLIGNGAANTLNGGVGGSGVSGNDTLDGELGADILTGGAGSDTFVFSSALGGGNVDHITDMAHGTDKIELWTNVFLGLAPGQLADSAFKANGVADADDRILYNSATGVLSFDQDGSGTAYDAVAFAILDNKPALSAADFTVHSYGVFA